MKTKPALEKTFPSFLAALLAPSLANAQIIVDDSWEDGDRLKTGALDANWWSSSNSNGNSVEFTTGELGMISGPSGRGIHGIFPAQNLAIGDTLVATYTFTTPTTIGADRSGAFKVALMSNNNAGLDADLTSSSIDPNPLYTDLPGYLVEFDVNKVAADDDTGIRKHNTPNATGRFLATTSEWTSLGSSADADYTILADTEYVGIISLTRTAEDSMQIFGSLSQNGVRLDSFTATDASAIANDIGMLGFWANSDAFGNTTTSDIPDNGITFTNITVELNPQVDVTVQINDDFADGDRAATGANDASWWSSSSTSGNSVEIAPGALGLVTGTSGRGMHGTFTPQTLEIGETIVATMTFTTPTTVGTNRGSGLKFALMDFNNPALAADLLSNSASVNPLYTDLPGYLIDLDVNTGAAADVTVRKHNTPNATGRFLGTTGEWTNMGSSGDAGYAFAPATEYVVEMSILRTGEDSVDISGSLSQGATLLDSFSTSDASGIANNFGMLGIWANSNTFGSTNAAGDPDNGLTFSNISIGVIELPKEPVDPGLVITSIVHDADAQTVTIEWIAEIGTTYFVYGSDDLTSFDDELDDSTATTTTGTFTEVGVTAPRRFYRVVPEE